MFFFKKKDFIVWHLMYITKIVIVIYSTSLKSITPISIILHIHFQYLFIYVSCFSYLSAYISSVNIKSVDDSFLTSFWIFKIFFLRIMYKFMKKKIVKLLFQMVNLYFQIISNKLYLQIRGLRVNNKEINNCFLPDFWINNQRIKCISHYCFRYFKFALYDSKD